MFRQFCVFFSIVLASQTNAQNYDFDLTGEHALLAENWLRAITSENGLAIWQPRSEEMPNMNWVDGHFFVGAESSFSDNYGQWTTEAGESTIDFSAANLLYWSNLGEAQLYADQAIDDQAMGLRAVVGPEGQYALAQEFAIRELESTGLINCVADSTGRVSQPCTSSFQTNDWINEACQRVDISATAALSHPCNMVMLDRGTSFVEIDCPYCYGTGTVTVRPPQIVLSPNGTDTLAFEFGGGLRGVDRMREETNVEEATYSAQLLHQIIVTALVDRLLAVSGEDETAKFIGVPSITYLWGREATTFNVVIPSNTVRDVQNRWDGFELTITGDLFQDVVSTGTSTTLARFSILVTSFKSSRRQRYDLTPPPIWDFYEAPTQDEQNAIEVRIANRLGSI